MARKILLAALVATVLPAQNTSPLPGRYHFVQMSVREDVKGKLTVRSGGGTFELDGKGGVRVKAQLGTNREAFSVASLTEPGSFDVDHLDDATIAGLSFFLVLPGKGDPVSRFDAMVETARALSVELSADLFDERGSSWSSQRERYLREELIEYRHQAERR